MNTRLQRVMGLALTLMPGVCPAGETYTLGRGTRMEDGCRPPCLCPYLFIGDVRGTFELTLVERGPLFDRYALSDIEWVAPEINVRFWGRGEYRIGGEVFLGQFLTLDLTASNGREYHLESDDPRGAYLFPTIRIAADDQVGEGCRYTEVFLDASPFCCADFNSDGGVDGGDVEGFFGAWEGGEPRADVNRDGGVDGGDVETFFAAWERGGCD